MKRGHSFDSIATLLLFCLFAGCMVVVLMTGVQSYQRVAASLEESYQERTCLQYIATKVNHFSGEGSVTVTQFGDGSALALEETLDGDDYVTYLYLYDGTVMELFCEVGTELGPDMGFAIMPMVEMAIEEITCDLLRISCTGNQNTASLLVRTHNGRETVG